VDVAFEAFEADLKKGPLMASVHYTFEPTNPIPHLVIINGIKDGEVYYNDPAAKNGGGTITIDKFKKSWKKRYLEFRPTA
jgi:ABC-type bacteriocin/lantibiotic exporter with double-glycine peptidase domain